MNSLNIIVDFSTYMYFSELKDLARYGTFSRCTSFQGHPRFKECDSFPGQVTVLKLCLCFVCLLNKIMVVRVYSR
ncbi:hypothetical protein HanPI659440_Chr06g0237191 [Helianthus annuus]|nr:hypothetical protein HanPI659440_Chr06g0237191 [Helianthus annuus]